MDDFFNNLLIFAFWGGVLGVMLLVIATGMKTPKPKTLPPDSPTKFVGRARVIETEYVNGSTSTRKAS